MSYTKGPWEMRDDKIVHYRDGDCFIICRVSDQTERNRADRKLICAAPELLEACQEALMIINNQSSVAEQLRDAIAKATG